jgi:hypothetical protein
MATVAATPRHHPRITARPVVLAAVSLAVAGFITYMVLQVPVAAPLPHGHVLLFCPIAPLPLPRARISGHWPLALAAAAIVLAVDAAALTVMRTRRRRRRRESQPGSANVAATSRRSPLRLERVPVRAVAIAGAASVTLLIAGFSQRYAMWLPVGVALLPWIPLLAAEAIWKYEHYGLWAIFGVAVLLQVGHMGEHTVQVAQLLLYDGRLAQSHGVFGQLDFETIHFFWDSAIWLILCVVFTRFAPGNRWLWVAFIAASLHEVEHLYLYWIYNADPSFYVHGGLEGIMGNGGLIGSPLARPYLHFTYNFLVVVPMVCAFLDQTKHVYERRAAGSPTTPGAGLLHSSAGAVAV